MSGAILRRRDQTNRPLRVDHYSAAVNILEVLNVSSGQNVATSYVFPTLIEPETYDVGATIEILAKDVSVYANEVWNGNSPNAVGALVNKICTDMEKEMPGADWSRMYPFIRDGGEG